VQKREIIEDKHVFSLRNIRLYEEIKKDDKKPIFFAQEGVSKRNSIFCTF